MKYNISIYCETSVSEFGLTNLISAALSEKDGIFVSDIHIEEIEPPESDISLADEETDAERNA
jgi:hypothetical protein